jgi:hypothetical protein
MQKEVYSPKRDREKEKEIKIIRSKEDPRK